MDQFSHDLTLALEETSLMMVKACGVSRWGSRRRTRSTGNLPCAPQPTEDSSSSPTDTTKTNNHVAPHAHANTNVDGLDTLNIALPASDSDEKEHGAPTLRLPCKAVNAAIRLGTLESDSLNETNFSPARFYKPNSRRKRKIKRMSMEFDLTNNCAASTRNEPTSPHSFTESPVQPAMLNIGITTNLPNTATGTVRKRLLKPETGNRSNVFFCGKRKRSNRDRYNDHEYTLTAAKIHSSSMPRHTAVEECRMRPRSYSSTSKPLSDRLLPLNKGLLSKIERISQLQKTEVGTDSCMRSASKTDATANQLSKNAFGLLDVKLSNALSIVETIVPVTSSVDALLISDTAQTYHRAQQEEQQHLWPQGEQMQQHMLQPNDSETFDTLFHQAQRKKCQINSNSKAARTRARRAQQLQFRLMTDDLQQSMDCSDLNDFLSSSSISSSSESEDDDRPNDTDREGDDELTDWPGNEFASGFKYDSKRKLTKKSTLPQIRSDETIGEDDTLMSGTESTIFGVSTTASDILSLTSCDALQELHRFQTSQPIRIATPRTYVHPRSFESDTMADAGDINRCDEDNNMTDIPAIKQIESEMSGETSNPFLSSSPVQQSEVREIRAGCRRIKGERAGFSIKLSVNERLARFLQDQRQTQIRLPDIEFYEHDSLLSLATLYSLEMTSENGCTVLTKTSNTTQSVSINNDQQQNLQSRHLFSDFKRRCYDGSN